MDNQIITYKGYDIEINFYGQSEVTIHYCGDDIVCESVEEAKKIIDSF